MKQKYALKSKRYGSDLQCSQIFSHILTRVFFSFIAQWFSKPLFYRKGLEFERASVNDICEPWEIF